MWHTSSALDITKREVIPLKTKLGGVSFDGTLAMVTNQLYSCYLGIPHITQEMLTQLCVEPSGLRPYITIVPTFPVWDLGPGNNYILSTNNMSTIHTSNFMFLFHVFVCFLHFLMYSYIDAKLPTTISTYPD